MKVHFIGINGSGISGTVCIAKSRGYDVDGCDIKTEGDYTEQLIKNNIKIEKGHSIEHLKNKELIVITPALLYNDQYKKIDEVKVAMETLPTMKWQKFLGDYITKEQNVVVVSGTHGKTTTTTLVALMLEEGGKDPTVMVGGEVKEWKQNYKIGKSDWYVLEGDEYDGNFLNYKPKYIIINNLEMEHPECFKNFDDYLDNFKNFIKKAQKNCEIVFYYDDKNVLRLIEEMKDTIIENGTKLSAFTLSNEVDYKIKNLDIKLYYIKQKKSSIEIENEIFNYNLLGKHNVKNIIAATILAMRCNVEITAIKNVLESFIGTKRRLDLIFENERVKIYDDYAHHHAQVHSTIEALKDNLENNEKIIAILEPHLISRIKQNTKDYVDAMKLSDYPIITKIYKSREGFLDEPNLVEMLNDKAIEYIESFDDIVNRVKEIIKNDENNFRILIMGAGYSYKLSKMLAMSLS